MFVPKIFVVTVFMSLLLLTTCKKRPKFMFQISEFKSNFERNHPEFERIVIGEPKKTTDDIDVPLTEEPKIPEGIEYMSKGYNIFTGDPFKGSVDSGHSNENIFIHNFEKSNDSSNSEKWLKSDTLEVVKVDGCYIRRKAQTITGETSYQKEMGLSVSMEDGIDKVHITTQFSASFSYHDASDQTHKMKNVMFSSHILCGKYNATTHLNSKLDSTFIEEVAALPKTDPDSEKTKEAYYDIFNNFGTHYIKTAYFGSRILLLTSISRDSYIELLSQGYQINSVAAAIIIRYLSPNNTYGFEQNTTYYMEFLKLVEFEDVSTRGSKLVDNSWFERSEELVPQPLIFKLAPISDLFQTSYFPGVPEEDLQAKKKMLIELMKGYCNVYLKFNDCREPKRDEELPPFTLPSPKQKDPVYLKFEGPRGDWSQHFRCGPDESGDSPIIAFIVFDYTTMTTLIDDLRIIRIKFTCKNAEHFETPTYKYEGDAESAVVCHDGFSGAQTSIQPWTEDEDNVALVCLRMLCGEDLLETKCNTDTGVESELKKCPEGTKITGMKAQFQHFMGTGDSPGLDDETALNGIEFTCT